MWFLYVLSWISLSVQLVFIVLSIVACLYYLAELAEEYTTNTRRVILFMISFVIFVYIMFMIFEEFPWTLVLCGLAGQIFHLIIMNQFPFVKLLSVPLMGSVAMLMVNHYLAFQYFVNVYVPFTQVLAYFTICIWMVPLALFVSLNTKDNMLPTINEQSHGSSPDVVSNYFSRNKKQGLLSMFNYVKETLLPQRSKKSF